MKKKLLQILCLSGVASVCFANTLFSIVPTTNPVTVRSDGYAVARYTVRNTGGNTYSNITTPALNVSGASIQSLDNTCAGASLAVGASCNFNVLISGATAPSTVRPRVCAANGVACSTANSANILAVDVTQVSQAYAYLPIITETGNSANKIVPVNIASPYAIGTGAGNNYTFTENIDSTGYNADFVSQNGQYVYAIDNPPQETSPDLIILEVTSSGLIQLSKTPIGSTSSKSYAIVVNSTGTRAYISDVISGNILVENISNKRTPTAMTSINLGLGGAETYVYGMAITPDNSTLYATDVFQDKIYILNVANDVNQLAATLTDLYHPLGVVVSPDGTKVYITNNGSSGYPLDIIDRTASTPALQNQTIQGLTNDDKPSGLALSADGTQIYVVGEAANAVYTVNASSSVGSTLTLANTTNDVGFYPQGIAISPDGSNLYVTEFYGNSQQTSNTVLYILNAITGAIVGQSASLGGRSTPLSNFVG
ncbi:MAG: YncE family protein [Gammaproteobacteria bacterium]|nr:YncE family protein [Gammaproteobacteria bacterium]